MHWNSGRTSIKDPTRFRPEIEEKSLKNSDNDLFYELKIYKAWVVLGAIDAIFL